MAEDEDTTTGLNVHSAREPPAGVNSDVTFRSIDLACCERGDGRHSGVTPIGKVHHLKALVSLHRALISRAAEGTGKRDMGERGERWSLDELEQEHLFPSVADTLHSMHYHSSPSRSSLVVIARTGSLPFPESEGWGKRRRRGGLAMNAARNPVCIADLRAYGVHHESYREEGSKTLASK